MKVSALDLRYKMKDVLKALEKNEPVAVFYRGKKKGVIRPDSGAKPRPGSVRNHPAFGIWKDREDMKDVRQFVRELRKGRNHAV